MTELNPEYVVTLRETLSSFYAEVGNFRTDQGISPAAGSQAATEQAKFSRPESLVTTWSTATLLIEAGGEHVMAFVKTITEPMEPLACWACVRSMLESCSLASWLLDPSIDVRTRIGRVFALRFEGLEQQQKFGRAVGCSNSELEDMKKRLDDVERDALRLEYPPVVNPRGRRIGIGQQMPSATDLIRLMLDEEAMYRLLSAVAHGHSWAIRSLGFQETADQASSLHIGGIPVHRFVKTTNIEGMAYLGSGAAKALAKPLWHQCRYFGWDEPRLIALFDSTFDKLQVRPAVRFWKGLSS